MSAPAEATRPDAPAVASPAGAHRGRAPLASWPADVRGLPARIIAFALLCAFGALHWAALVADAPLARVAAVVALTTAGGAALALTVHVARRSRIATMSMRLGLALATLAATFATVGLPTGLLLPRRWDELLEGVGRGLAAIRTVTWPYAGADDWPRLTVLLGIPLLAALAALLAFWPAGRRAAPVLRLAALALLVTLYAIPATEYAFTAELLRGVVLFALIAAWLWLPRLRPGGRRAAVAAVLGAGVLALPVAAAVEGRGAWVDYRNWQWFGAGTGGASFDWSHSYGPMDWPRTGKTLFWVKSNAPHYWKVESLDRFDGIRWLHSGQPPAPNTDLPPAARFIARWNESIRFTVRSLRSDRLVAAGLTYRVFSDADARMSGDGPTWTVEQALQAGDSYDVRAYVPEPSARDLRAAPISYVRDFDWYTRLELPSAGLRVGSRRANAPLTARREPVDPGLRAVSPAQTLFERSERRAARSRARRGRARLLASPYRRVFRRARRFARGAASPYVVARRIERYLKSDRFEYSEDPPQARYPLASFLLDDRRGYCQQFSGVMALMLRMNGIPARVAAGFAPGRLNKDTGEYRVRDLDAHSWVEVNFPEIGWVAFDPTPSAAPAAAQTADREGDSAADRGGVEGAPGQSQRLPDRQSQSGGALGPLAEVRSRWRFVPPALVALAVLAVAGLWLRALILRRRRREQPEPELSELEAALGRLGYEVPAGTTLLALEQRLAHAAGPPAADYARRLRQRRYSPGGAPAPDRRERRALRRSLTSRAGPLGRARGYIALPPHGFHAPSPRRRSSDLAERPEPHK